MGLMEEKQDTRAKRKSKMLNSSFLVLLVTAALLSVILSYGPDIIRYIIHFFQKLGA